MKSVDHFTHRGRRVRLFKRTAGPAAAWYIMPQRRGKRLPRSLGTPIKSLAITKAKVLLDALDSGEVDAAKRLMQRPGDVPASTVGEILAWAGAAALDIGDHTRRNYTNCLRLLLSRAHPGADVDRLSANCLDAPTVRAYFRQAADRATAANGDQDLANRIRRSANSVANQARCLLSPRCVGDMRDAGLILPDLTAFHAEVEARRLRVSEPKQWHAPGQAVILTTVRQWRALGRDPQRMADPLERNTYFAIWLMLSCGLRKGEASQAQWEWFPTGKRGRLEATALTKDRSGWIRVDPLQPWFAAGWRDGQTGPILAGTATETGENVFRRVGALLRDCGWKTQKTNHALRALAGAWCVRKRGIYAAQQFLRHSSVTITERHYSHIIQP